MHHTQIIQHPLKTIEAYLKAKDGNVALPISQNEIDNYFDDLRSHGIDINLIYDELLKEGLEAFENSFIELLELLK